MEKASSVLNSRVPKLCRILFVVLLASLPTVFVLRQFDPHYGFTKLITFGEDWLPRAIPEVRPFLPPSHTRRGCDGQFYAQLAIDPSLRNGELATACDLPEYRARRIFLPFLAWCIGLGKPAAVLNSYSLLNLFFWYLLLGLLVFSLKPQSVRHWLCIAGTVWTTGVLVSVKHSFVDLPAATLIVLAAVVPLQFRAIAAAVSILTKESYLICSWSFVFEAVRARWHWRKIVGQVGIMFGPILLWTFYVHQHFSSGGWNAHDYGWPMLGWSKAIARISQRHDFIDGIAASSLLVQFVYLLCHRRLESGLWRIGVTFGIAAAFLGGDPFIDYVSFTRDLIAMSVAFNALLMKQESAFLPWYVFGNAGLLTFVVKMVRFAVAG